MEFQGDGSKGDGPSSPPLKIFSIESLFPSLHQLPTVMNPNLKITPSLFDGKNYQE